MKIGYVRSIPAFPDLFSLAMLLGGLAAGATVLSPADMPPLPGCVDGAAFAANPDKPLAQEIVKNPARQAPGRGRRGHHLAPQ
jgi:hypothetical protein